MHFLHRAFILLIALIDFDMVIWSLNHFAFLFVYCYFGRILNIALQSE